MFKSLSLLPGRLRQDYCERPTSTLELIDAESIAQQLQDSNSACFAEHAMEQMSACVCIVKWLALGNFLVLRYISIGRPW
jgi:hypothetical protein